MLRPNGGMRIDTTNPVAGFYEDCAVDAICQKANWQNRYPCELRNVQRWTEDKGFYVLRKGAQMTRLFDDQIARYVAGWRQQGVTRITS